MHILLLSIHSFVCFWSLYCTNTYRCPSKMRIQKKNIRKNQNIKQGCSFGLSHETSYFFFVSLKVFQCSMSFIAFFLFCLFGTHVFNLRHTTNPWTLFLLRCCSKTCDNLRFRNHVLKKCISKLRKCVYLYREMNKTSHHSCSYNKSDYLSLWLNDSRSRIFCFDA